MKKASRILAVLAICFGVALPIEIYLGSRHCQFDAEADAWRAAKQQKTGVDPCDENNSPNFAQVAVPVSFAFFTFSAIVTGGLSLIQDRRKSVIKEMN